MGAVQSSVVTAGWDDRVVAAHSLPHFMQSSTWERIRRSGPWRTRRLGLGTVRDLPVVSYERDAPGYGTLQHLPRVSGIDAGGVAAFTERVREDRGTAFATKVEVHQPHDAPLVEAFRANGWQPTRASQYRHAVVVETAMSEQDLLARMKKRARSEIRVAERNGVIVGRATLTRQHVAEMQALVRETEQRSGAFFRSDDYLESVWRAFADDDRGALYFAWHEGRVVAGAFVITYGPNAWYKDGGSLRDQPQLMASRLLQWGIMRELRERGVQRYDLGHVPPPDEPEAPGRGILTFKSAFSPDLTVYMPAFLLAHEPRADQFRREESAFLDDYRERTGDYWY